MARALAIIVIIPTVYAFAVPPLLGTALGHAHTGPLAGSQVYRFPFWIIAWGLILWQGTWMRKAVHDRIFDDMAVTTVAAAGILLGVKFVTWFIFEPANTCTVPMDQVTVNNIRDVCNVLSFVTMIDVLAAVIAVVLGFVGALANRFG
jgi:hypothetical protein